MIAVFSRMRISKKLPLIMVGLAILNIAIVSAVSSYFSYKEAISLASKEIKALNYSSKKSVDTYLSSIQEDLTVLAHNDYLRQALRDFSNAWNEISGNQTKLLQDLYIQKNPNPTGQKHLLDAATDGSAYSLTHAKYHPWFREFLMQRGYYDIFLFTPKGDLVYTVFKELDYATNLMSGEWKDSDLGNVFRKAMENPAKDHIAFFDFKAYGPSHGAPASFIGMPILDGFGNLMGVLVFQMPVDRLNAMVALDKSIGETANSYLVGQDYLMRTNDQHSEESTILKVKVEEDAVKHALQGENGVMVELDVHTGNQAIIGYSPVDFHGVRWALITVLAKDEVLSGFYKSLKTILFVNIAIIAVIVALSLWYARSLVNPISRMVEAMKTLASGNHQVAIPSLERADEIGDMAKAVQVFKENAIEMEAMQAEQEKLKAKAEQEKKEAMAKLAQDFDSRTGGLIKNLSSSSVSMQKTAQDMTAASEQTAHASSSVAAAAEEANANVQTVASAAEELASSSSEIARQISDVAQRASRAADEAQSTSKSVHELNTLADGIGEVVSAIKEIADQTNLLALNATIEAARAGAAGKGFAVVADEVKKLATETAQKTDEIDDRVENIQRAIRASVEAMNRIIDNVQQIDQATASVASAVEEQNAATAEIGRNVTEASTGTTEVSRNIQEVQQTAAQTGSAANDVLTASTELARISENLQQEITKFLAEISGGKKSSGDGEYKIAAE